MMMLVKIKNADINLRLYHLFGSTNWKHSELMFEKKALIPEIQRLLIASNKQPRKDKEIAFG